MKTLSDYLLESQIDQEDIKYLNDICDVEGITIGNTKYTIMVLSDYADTDIVVKQLKNDDFDSRYVIETVTDDYDEYDWDEDQELLINYAIEHDDYEIYQIIEGTDSSSQPIGLVVSFLLKKRN